MTNRRFAWGGRGFAWWFMCFNHYFGKAGGVEFLSATSTPSPASTASASTEWCRSSATSSRSWRSCSCAVRSAVSFKPRKLMIFQVQGDLDWFFINEIYCVLFVLMTLFISILGLYMLCWWSFNTLSWYLQVCLCFFDLCCKYIFCHVFCVSKKNMTPKTCVCVCVCRLCRSVLFLSLLGFLILQQSCYDISIQGLYADIRTHHLDTMKRVRDWGKWFEDVSW